MMLYKLTDADGWTRRGEKNACQWGPDVTHSGTGEGELCGRGYIHAYEHPLIAVLMDPIHARYLPGGRMWEAEGEVALRVGHLKCGCVSLTTVREIDVPEITTEQRVRFAILCAKRVCDDPKWNRWADGWLSGEDRSATAAEAAARLAAAAEAARSAAGLDLIEIAKEATE